MLVEAGPSGPAVGVSGTETYSVVVRPSPRVEVTRVQPPRWVRTMPGRGSPAESSAVMPPQ